MQIDVTVQDANNILCEVTPPQPQIIVIDRGVAGNGIVSIVPVTISTFQYLRITYTNGTVQDVGPLTSTAYTATAPITIVGNTISLATVPIASGGTDATTAAGAIQNLLPSYTGNANKRLGLNSTATGLEWVLDGGGTVTSVAASGGTTGLTFTGSPITTSGTLTLGGTLAVANGGTGVTSSTGTGSVVLSTSPTLVTPVLGTPTSGNFSTGTFTWPTFNQNTSGTAAGLSATLAITSGGTGQTTANAAFNALAPSQTDNSGKYLTTDGTNTSWATNPLGTVTSVGGTGTVSGITLSGTVTTSGNLTLGGTLDLSAYNGAGAFTTLSASSTVTLSGGTANGVTYLNASKVLTSGSALTFDGTNLGVGVSSPSANLHVQSTQASMNMRSTGTGNPYIDFYTSTSTLVGNIYGVNGGGVAFGTNGGTEGMRLTSTGLGIGTSSPSAKLDLSNTSRIKFNVTSTTNAIEYWKDATPSFAASTGTGTATGLASAYKVDIFNGSTWATATTIDSSGNLGLGVTPSAWSTIKALQVGYSSLGTLTSNTYLNNNTYYNGTNWIYSTTAAAGKYQINDSVHSWHTASSGTAGNAITFTQAMTLAASGGLSVGTTTDAGAGCILVSSFLKGAGWQASSTTTAASIYNGIYAITTDTIGLATGGSERARIDSSGNLLVGTTTAQAKITTVTTGNAVAGFFKNDASGYQTITVQNAGASGTRYLEWFVAGTTDVGSISSNGTTTSYNTSSDYRLKNITGALTGYKERLMSLQPKQGTWKADGSEFRGFLAHEFADHYRASVTGEKDAVDAEGNPIYQAMQASSSEVMADLVAMVNELITENASLKARLDAANL